MRKYEPFLLFILAFLLPLGLYIKTLSPIYIPIDSAEFALCIKYWGICHPPGFPLYIMIGHFFTSIFPFGTLIYKANLLSAFFGACGILTVYLALRKLEVSAKLSLFLALLLAVSAVYWEFSLAADVFTFGAFLVALSFYFAFSKHRLLSFFTLGLASSHFYITAVFWPVFVWYFWGNRRVSINFINIITIIKFILAFTIGFFPQAVMYWRMQQNPAVNWGHAQGFLGFWYFIRRQEFGSIFLLSNPALTFSIFKLIKQFKEYFVSTLVNFGVILPIIAVFVPLFKPSRETKLLLFSLFVFLFVQLTLLSTIDPTGENNPFQLNKFYLTSFIFIVLLSGKSLETAGKKFFDGLSYLQILVAFLVVVYFLANLRTNNYSKNRFSQFMVYDALSVLPEGSVAITVSHVFYFGGRLEQEVNSKFKNIDLLYFPNEKNKDNEYYKPDLFSRQINEDFIRTVKKNKSLGKAEEYILSAIGGNLNRDIFILQGTFEEGFFQYLKPYIVPYGLWWRVVPDLSRKGELFGADEPFSGLKNADIRSGELILKQQKLDALSYAVSFHSTGIFFGSIGEYDKAIFYLDKSLFVNSKADNIQAEKELILKVKKMKGDKEKWVIAKDSGRLTEYGNNLFTLGDFKQCEEIFGIVTEMDDRAENFANLAACQASAGKVDFARENYQRALATKPDLDIAKKGLEALD